MSRYEENRSKFRLCELQQYAGQWVAFSADGSEIIGSAATLAALEQQLVAQGVDAQSLAFEFLEFEDSFIGGSEFL
jgi:hypothetical protein